jgi:FOG: HEAT repeat
MKNSALTAWILPSAVITLVATGPVSLGDVIRLRNGGEIRGEILGENSESEPVTIVTAAGTRILIDRAEIDFVERRPALIEEYITRSRRLPDTVEAHWDLAEWCRVHQLSEERREQLEMLLELDPDHEEARKVLGYVRHLGRWMTREDQMAERGYIRHNGKWVTRQELELKLANSAQQKAELEWMPRIRLWAQWLSSPDPQRAATGYGELQKVNDPDAIAALTKFLAQHAQEEARILYVNVLGQIDSPRSVPPLVDRILMDVSDVVRRAALAALTPARYPLAFPILVNALRHKENSVVCHAAEALGEIGDERAIPPLIDALVTRHMVQVLVPVNQGVTFTSSTPGPFSGTLPPEIEIAARTGQLPYGVQVIDNIPRQMKPVKVAQDVKNLPVLNALEKMTGRSFGFNERDWHLWWAVHKE